MAEDGGMLFTQEDSVSVRKYRSVIDRYGIMMNKHCML